MDVYRKLRATLHPFRAAFVGLWYRFFPPIQRGLSGVWLDVGAHVGESTMRYARVNPELTIYAFEPTPECAAKMRRVAPSNYHVIEKAVSEVDGYVTFHLNDNEMTNSLLQLRPEGVSQWTPEPTLKELSQQRVESIRLDTFLRDTSLTHVLWLKIDTQGADLAVIKSAGAMLSMIESIQLEVNVASEPVYAGECCEADVLSYLSDAGFVLTAANTHPSGLYKDLSFARKENERRQ